MKLIKRGAKPSPEPKEWPKKVHCEFTVGHNEKVCGAQFLVDEEDVKKVVEDHDRYVDIWYEVKCPSCHQTGTFR